MKIETILGLVMAEIGRAETLHPVWPSDLVKAAAIPAEEAGDYEITYYRYPALSPDEPDDNAMLDNTPDTHLAIPYYVASKLLMSDDEFQCALCNNTWDEKLRMMQQDINVEVRTVEDVYGFNL